MFKHSSPNFQAHVSARATSTPTPQALRAAQEASQQAYDDAFAIPTELVNIQLMQRHFDEAIATQTELSGIMTLRKNQIEKEQKQLDDWWGANVAFLKEVEKNLAEKGKWTRFLH